MASFIFCDPNKSGSSITHTTSPTLFSSKIRIISKFESFYKKLSKLSVGVEVKTQHLLYFICMQLSNIQQFLEVYRQKLFIVEGERSVIIDTIKKISGVTLLDKELQVKKGTLFINSDSITRNQIYLYRSKLLEEFKKISPTKIFDIR